MTRYALITMAAILVGWVLGGCVFVLSMRRLTGAKLGSVTKLLFVVIMWAAIAWVSISYAIAIYSTVRLGQVYTMAELSDPAIRVLLGAVVLKVLENIFEHNDGALFGHTKKKEAHTYD